MEMTPKLAELLQKISENTTPPPPEIRKSEMSRKEKAEYISASGGRNRLTDDQIEKCYSELPE